MALLQDCEYAFVLDRPNVKLTETEKEASATPDEVRDCLILQCT